jgi:hypothetical protein
MALWFYVNCVKYVECVNMYIQNVGNMPIDKSLSDWIEYNIAQGLSRDYEKKHYHPSDNTTLKSF